MAGLCSAWPAKLLNADLMGDGSSGRKEMKYDLRSWPRAAAHAHRRHVAITYKLGLKCEGERVGCGLAGLEGPHGRS